MRIERDALGELQISDDSYFGIDTARLISAANVPGPEFPVEIAQNIVRVRQAQAIAFGRNKSWSGAVAASVERAAELIASGGFSIAGHLKVRPAHGGGARGIVMNVDEVLANVALEGAGSPKGEYHILAPLFQMDRGIHHLETFLVAFHITMIQELSGMMGAVDSLVLELKRQEQALQKQGTVVAIQFQDVAISNMGAEFGQCSESLMRSRQQIDSFRTALLTCWKGPSGVLRALQELVGIDLDVSKESHDIPGNMDLYVGVSVLLKSIALALLHFCNKMKVLIGVTQEIELPRVRANPPFNPAAREFLILDSVSQMAFSIIGGETAITAATGAAADSAAAYIPLVSSQLIWSGKCLTISLQMLAAKFVADLTGNAEPGMKHIAETPLQAERLISLLGYDRAVQVARIAALTGKPVRMVVRKMKLLTEEQINLKLPVWAEDEPLE